MLPSAEHLEARRLIGGSTILGDQIVLRVARWDIHDAAARRYLHQRT